jgi:cell wall-associated NlpC family hydrolase
VRLIIAAWLALLLAACATHPPRSASVQDLRGPEIAQIASGLVGTPYHFGGADKLGFDCSGLAVYAYEHAGVDIPRTAREQRDSARPVPLSELAPGDLVFFRMHSRHVDHVGIYVGSGRFVHAPKRGGSVSYASLDDRYFQKRLVAAGRFAG